MLKMQGSHISNKWQQGDVAGLKNPTGQEIGTVICNPPYGERLGTTPAFNCFIFCIRSSIKKTEFADWNVSIFSGEPALLDCYVYVRIVNLRQKRSFRLCPKNYHIAVRKQVESAVENSQEKH